MWITVYNAIYRNWNLLLGGGWASGCPQHNWYSSTWWWHMLYKVWFKRNLVNYQYFTSSIRFAKYAQHCPWDDRSSFFLEIRAILTPIQSYFNRLPEFVFHRCNQLPYQIICYRQYLYRMEMSRCVLGVACNTPHCYYRPDNWHWQDMTVRWYHFIVPYLIVV